MKKITLFAVALFFGQLMFAQVGVGTFSPDANAQLDVTSTTKGVLLPRLNQTEADALAVNLVGEPAGMLIENTSIPCVQRWNGTSFQCLAVVTGGQTGNAGVVRLRLPVTNNGATPPIVTPSTSDPGYIDLDPISGNGGGTKWYPLNVDPGEFIISPAPTTSWPENAPDQTISGIWTNNVYTVAATPGNQGLVGGIGDAFLENPTLGQVHVWRINMYSISGNSSQKTVSVRLRNPSTGFQTATVVAFSPAAGTELQTAILYTIADCASLPNNPAGICPVTSGTGYIMEFLSGTGAFEIVVESITRVSIFND